MKTLLTLCASILFITADCTAQGEPEPNDSRASVEISANMSRFMGNFLNFGGDAIVEDNASILMLKFRTSEKAAFRLGLDIQSLSTKDGPNVAQKSSLVGLKLGLETRKRVGKKWAMNIGGDFLFVRQASEQSVFDPFGGQNDIQVTGIGLGAEAMLGFQYNISNRVSIWTEAYLLGITTTDKVSGVGPSGSDDNRTSTQIRLVSPTSLYLSIGL